MVRMNGRLIKTLCSGFFVGALVLSSCAALGFHKVHAGDHGHSDCPFMPGEQSVCPMGILDHLAVWKAAFVAPSALLLVASFVLVALFFIIGSALAPGDVSRFARKRFERKNEPLLYQTLFAAGILNPKPY